MRRSGVRIPLAPRNRQRSNLAPLQCGWGSGVAVLRFRGRVEDRRDGLGGLNDDLFLVVETVAGQPVDLVDDTVLHLVRADVVEHFLECFAVGGVRGLAGLDELRDDDRVQLLGFPVGGFALRGDREAFCEAVASGLVLGGDPQVGDSGGLPVRQDLVSFFV